jgi:ankyrin repeat protein
MSRSLSSASSLESLRKEAKRWLKALRAGDPEARHRLLAVTPQAPAEPGLRDVQLALAREHGLPGWSALRAALDELALDRLTEAERIDILLRSCAWQGDRAAAERVLRRWPDTGRTHFHCAVVRGETQFIARALAAEPSLATRTGGPLDWTPLLYLAYGRLPGGERTGIAIAGLLLDHGADPNASWNDGWDNPFTVLCGVIGLGEGVHPPHPQDRELAALLVERGASPFDTQALYNSSIVDDDTRWLEFLWSHSETRGLTERWLTAPKSGGIGGKLKLPPVDYLLGNAVAYGHLRRTAWLLAHGARADGVAAYSGRSLRDEALVYGRSAVAALLERNGAPAGMPEGDTAFQVACFALDRPTAARLVAAHPEYLQDAAPLIQAALTGRADVAELLLDLGMPVDVADEGGVRALQRAIGADAREVVELLLAHGADVDRPSRHYGGGMGFAAHYKRRELAALLAPRSRDVHNLVNIGMGDRLQELFATEPALVNAIHPRGGITPLFALPDDEALALDMATLLLEHGADRKIRNRQGHTPAEAASRRGMVDVADLLDD